MHHHAIANHYTHGSLLSAIEEAVHQLGKSTEEVTVEELSPVDEFHIGGKLATEHLLTQVDFSENDHVIDIGCGLGGTARQVAHKFKCRVTGIDLTPEYVATGNTLSAWVGLTDRVTLREANALVLPFGDSTFSKAIMIHAGMNIEDKPALFREVYRVLERNASWVLYDIMRLQPEMLRYPVPWASTEDTSFLETPEEYQTHLTQAGFAVTAVNNRLEFALRFFTEMKQKAVAGHRPLLGLHILMQEDTATKINNMIANLETGLIVPVEIVVKKVQ